MFSCVIKHALADRLANQGSVDWNDNHQDRYTRLQITVTYMASLSWITFDQSERMRTPLGNQLLTRGGGAFGGFSQNPLKIPHQIEYNSSLDWYLDTKQSDSIQCHIRRPIKHHAHGIYPLKSKPDGSRFLEIQTKQNPKIHFFSHFS